MLLSDAGADLFGPNEQRILNILGKTNGGLHVRLIEREAGTPHFTTGGILRRLAKSGLLTEQQIGTSLVYSVNRGHVLWLAVETALGAHQRVLDRIKAVGEPLTRERATVALYGSTARQESTSDSDINLAIIYPDDTEYTLVQHTIEELTHDLETFTGNRVEVYNIDYGTLKEMISVNEEMLDTWAAEAVTIDGPNIQKLISDNRGKKKGK